MYSYYNQQSKNTGDPVRGNNKTITIQVQEMQDDEGPLSLLPVFE